MAKLNFCNHYSSLHCHHSNMLIWCFLKYSYSYHYHQLMTIASKAAFDIWTLKSKDFNKTTVNSLYPNVTHQVCWWRYFRSSASMKWIWKAPEVSPILMAASPFSVTQTGGIYFIGASWQMICEDTCSQRLWNERTWCPG